jgi:hypothetical protein
VDFLVNGTAFAVGTSPGDTLGAALAEADDLLERAGSVITGLSVDGSPVDPENFAMVRDRRISGIGRVELFAETSSDYRARAIGLLLDLVGTAALAAAVEAGGDGDRWIPLRAGVERFLADLAGLFPADELSFIQNFVDLVAAASEEAAARGGIPSEETLRGFGQRVAAFDALFRERLAELEEPVSELRRTAALFQAESSELRELPVYLQTGKEDRAMRAVLLFIEIFDKVRRLIPELRRNGVETEAVSIDGLGLPEFYASFNEMLRTLSKALEDKDSVLIGDLAEYEVAPRMGAFFAAMEAVLPR